MKKIIWIMMIIAISSVAFGAGTIKEDEKKNFKTKFLIPSPSEVFAALDSLQKTDWKSVVFYMQKDENKKRDTYKNTYIIALNSGIRIADAFLYIQANDKKNFSENALTIKKYASSMGISSQLIKKTDKIKDLASKEEWKELKKELDGLQNSILGDLSKVNDTDTATLASMAAWLEGLHLVSKTLTENYDADTSMVLRQPELVEFFSEELNKMGKGTKELQIVKEMTKEIKTLKSLTNVGQGKAIEKENVDKIYEISSRLIKDIEKSDL